MSARGWSSICRAVVPVLTLLASLAWSSAAAAEAHAAPPAEATVSSEAEHGGDAHQATAEHASAACQDHWSLLDAVFPAARHNLCGVLGKTYLNGDPVARGSHLIMAGLVFVLIVILAIAARRALRREDAHLIPPPKLGLLTFFELLIGYIFNMMVGLMGEKKARRCFPLVGSLGVFILFSNLLGAIPGFLPPTDNLSTTLALGSVVFVATHYFGVREHGIRYFKHFLGPIPWLAPLMLPIELVSHLVRPASLAVRLMGNMFGDHAVLGIFLSFGFLLVPLPIELLGLIVALVQTLVFCLLSTVYFALAVEHEEHG